MVYNNMDGYYNDFDASDFLSANYVKAKAPDYLEVYELESIIGSSSKRVSGHMITRLQEDTDKNRKSPIKGWQEVDLYNYIKDSQKDANIMQIELKNANINVYTDSGRSVNLINSESTSYADKFHDKTLNTIVSTYIESKDSAAENEYFLKIDNDRAYGFVLLNMHTADIDVKRGKLSSHISIRYNENISNTRMGWRLRMQYIDKIFSDMGFSTLQKEGYLHMNCSNPEDFDKVLGEAIRGLISTTHLNIAFEYYPATHAAAIKAFKSGITNVHDFIYKLPAVVDAENRYRQQQFVPAKGKRGSGRGK